MSALLVATLCAVMVATSFISGVFGMAGGLILVGVLILLLPVQDALALHGITQMASNGWRATLWWRHVRWRPAAGYMAGCGLVLALWSVWQYVPSKAVALIALGALPFASRLLPDRLRGDPASARHAGGYGALCMMLMLLTGVAGPVLDQFFLNGRLDRREIIATKGICQIFGHAAKVLYFSGLVAEPAAIDPWLAGLAVAASLVGTALSKRLLEAMSDAQYRLWAGRLITVVAGYYLVHGGMLLAQDLALWNGRLT